MLMILVKHSGTKRSHFASSTTSGTYMYMYLYRQREYYYAAYISHAGFALSFHTRASNGLKIQFLHQHKEQILLRLLFFEAHSVFE